MNHRFSRSVTALALVASLGVSATAAFAAPLAQTQDAKTSDQKKSGDKKTPAASGAQRSSNGLPVNEDPTQIGKRNINKGIIARHSGSTEKEVAVGRQLASEVDREAKLIDDPAVTEYVNRVGQNIVLHSDAKVPFTIKVIDSDEVNAFALPGGFFYVNKGLLLAADNEAELAGAMAHEIAHVAARHAMENQTKAGLMQILATAATIATGGIAGEIIYDTAGFWLPLSLLKFSRGAEGEADRLGVQYMYAAGYDPNAMSTMFEKLLAKNKKKPGTIAKVFSDHPQTTDRIESSRALVARFPEREEYVMNTSEFQRVKARLLRLSNARATSAGSIAAGDDSNNNGPAGRPTLKRRQGSADDTTTTVTPATGDSSTSGNSTNDSRNPSNSTQPSSTKPSGPPTLKHRDADTQTAPASSTPPSAKP
ncbi:MAG: M48 family metallopeptidase [Pyrinomonadaceae bacterium]